MAKAGNEIPEGASAALIMADGKIFYGKAIGGQALAIGEICFNTALTGYQETITDPSYSGQIITFTFPHIGNVGINDDDAESLEPVAKGVVMREDITNPSNFRSQHKLAKWLKGKHIAGICGVDTRAITRHVRLNGAQNVAIYHFGKNVDIAGVLKKVVNYPSLEGMELAAGASRGEVYKWDKNIWQLNGGVATGQQGKYKVVAVDYGAKLNILRCLVNVGCEVTVVAAKTTAAEILKMKPDGVFLSNGPGDPAATGEYAVAEIRKLIAANLPVFGICLGHQLVALALGCVTTKNASRAWGANHPVQDLLTKKVEITSQNHGFVVCKKSLPDDVEITHLSLFDDTIEGIKSKSKPVFSVQYHPESSPGPHDSFYLFKRFVGLMAK